MPGLPEARDWGGERGVRERGGWGWGEDQIVKGKEAVQTLRQRERGREEKREREGEREREGGIGQIPDELERSGPAEEEKWMRS